MEDFMKSLRISVLSLALLVPAVSFTAEPAVAAKTCTVCEKVGNVVKSVKAQLPSVEAAKTMVKNAPKNLVAYAKDHPVKFGAIVAVTAAVVYAAYKLCKSSKKETKVIVVK